MFQDAIDFSQAVMGDPTSPAINQYPIGAHLERVHFSGNVREYERGPVNVWFAGRNQLVPAFGTQGDIAYTIWGGRHHAGTWVFAPWVECIRDYVPVGQEWWNVDHIAKNLLYWHELDPRVRGWQPQPGERIALVCTTGDTRRQAAFTSSSGQPVAQWRTTVVLVPFAIGDYRPDLPAPGTPPAPPVPTPPSPFPLPVPPPAPPSTDWQATALQLARTVDALTERLAAAELRADARAEAYTLLETDIRTSQAALAARLQAIEQRPLPTHAVISLFGRDVRVPLR